MLVGLQHPKFKLLPEDVKNIPDFWFHDYYNYVFHNDYYVLPSFGEKIKIAIALENDNYKESLKFFLDNNPGSKNIIAFNEIFKSDAGLFSTALRGGMTVDKIKSVLIFIKENSMSEISITEHRLGSMFLVRRGWFKQILKECKDFVDSIGIQLWVQPSSPLYNLQKELAVRLIVEFQEMGFPVYISECAIFEKNRKYQAEVLDILLGKLKSHGVTSFCYWHLQDDLNRTQPNRDCSLGPGLFTEDWQPKPILDVFKSYAQSF